MTDMWLLAWVAEISQSNVRICYPIITVVLSFYESILQNLSGKFMKTSKPKRLPWQRFSELITQEAKNKYHEYHQPISCGFEVTPKVRFCQFPAEVIDVLLLKSLPTWDTQRGHILNMIIFSKSWLASATKVSVYVTCFQWSRNLLD